MGGRQKVEGGGVQGSNELRGLWGRYEEGEPWEHPELLV